MLPRYDVLVVDPPWAYGKPTAARVRAVTAEHHYATLGNDGIIAQTPVLDWRGDDSHLYLWTTNPKLPFAFAIMEAWGYSYKTTLTWVKTTGAGAVHGGGMGWFYRGATEHVLFGIRGRKPIPSALRRPNVIHAPPTGHSTKPTAFYDLLRSIYSEDERMLDAYARARHSRFDAWGLEAPSVAAD